MALINGLLIWFANEEYIDLRPYASKVLRHWPVIVIGAAVGFVLTFFVTRQLAKQYQANAIIHPISTSGVESRIGGFVGGLGGGLEASTLGGLAASFGAASNDADEYVSILTGFQFNTIMVQKHHLERDLLDEESPLDHFLPSSNSQPKWRIYGLLTKRFDCEVSPKTGNIQLSFAAHSQKQAEVILNYYIDDLRDLLRKRAINGSSAAIASLESEAASTADPLLRDQLYNLAAKQLLREKMAQVEADFAFRVLFWIVPRRQTDHVGPAYFWIASLPAS